MGLSDRQAVENSASFGCPMSQGSVHLLGLVYSTGPQVDVSVSIAGLFFRLQRVEDRERVGDRSSTRCVGRKRPPSWRLIIPGAPGSAPGVTANPVVCDSLVYRLCPEDRGSLRSEELRKGRAMQIDGSKIVVTGASSGIGEALAPMLAERGATVGIVARRGQARSHSRALSETLAGLEDVGGRPV